MVNPNEPEVENQAPVVNVSAPSSANHGDQVVVSAEATDADNDTLTYSWEAPAGVSISNNGSSISFVAPEFSQDTSLTFTASVSDGQIVTSASATILVFASGNIGNQCDNLWDPTASYAVPGTQVVWDGKVWENKWHANPGENPSDSGPWGTWKQVGDADCSSGSETDGGSTGSSGDQGSTDTTEGNGSTDAGNGGTEQSGQCDNLWDATVAYSVPGTQVVWDGQVWENKWYAEPGENPSDSGPWDVWKQVGVADCSAQ
jgi:hypothetical protein